MMTPFPFWGLLLISSMAETDRWRFEPPLSLWRLILDMPAG